MLQCLSWASATDAQAPGWGSLPPSSLRPLQNPAGQRVTRILEAAAAAGAEHARRISTATINMVIRETVNWRAPPTLRGASRKGRIYYATQARGARHAPPHSTRAAIAPPPLHSGGG